MKISRRGFLGAAGASTIGGVIGVLGLPKIVKAESIPEIKTLETTESTTICPYCGVGCGLIVSTREGKVINIEGDPDHPINEGSLCSKGMALFQVAVNERRLQKVKYRAPGSSEWEEKYSRTKAISICESLIITTHPEPRKEVVPSNGYKSAPGIPP